ncbi:ferredoxin--NADP reductase [Haloarchaeobius amylolyticus]|uniref:ferredoxin--NADP reductase n=1 Tax=Haloarchaeobius amylolyticus TaxID=1198296 RepID=UPI0022721AFE|nr:FAD-binding oxidoreductase [Haloarchaeobius amylolyticus]
MTYSAEVVAVHQQTPDVKQFRLRVDDHEFDHDPGQHVTVQFTFDGEGTEGDVEPGEEVVRPYTPTNLPGTGELTLAIKQYQDGLASAYMHQRRVGDEVTLGEPEGDLHVREYGNDVAFVSTGTGITPMLAMLRDYLDRGEGHVHFVHGARDREHVMFRETLEGLASEHANLDLTFVLSESEPSWNGRIGHVQDHLGDLFDAVDDRDHYVCGVPEMVVETRETLHDLGAPDERVYAEGWESDAVGEGDGDDD